jgi:hypothetical protein
MVLGLIVGGEEARDFELEDIAVVAAHERVFLQGLEEPPGCIAGIVARIEAAIVEGGDEAVAEAGGKGNELVAGFGKAAGDEEEAAERDEGIAAQERMKPVEKWGRPAAVLVSVRDRRVVKWRMSCGWTNWALRTGL